MRLDQLFHDRNEKTEAYKENVPKLINCEVRGAPHPRGHIPENLHRRVHLHQKNRASGAVCQKHKVGELFLTKDNK